MYEQQQVKSQESGSGAAENVTELAAITVSSRLPEFWTDMPRLWFAQVESILASQKQGDETKYNLVVAKMGREALQQVSDILLSPPAENKYQALKDRLLQVYEESAERQFQKLVGEIELGSQKPSQLLRRMRDLGRNAKVSEQTLHSLWMARLPTNVRAVLTVSQDQQLENLALIADKIMENIHSSDIAAVSTSAAGSSQSTTPDISAQMHSLSLEIASLREEVQQSRRNAWQRGSDRGGFRGRFRPRSRSRTPSDPNWLCRWHFRYRNKARECEKPCAWKSSSEN